MDLLFQIHFQGCYKDWLFPKSCPTQGPGAGTTRATLSLHKELLNTTSNNSPLPPGKEKAEEPGALDKSYSTGMEAVPRDQPLPGSVTAGLCD